MIAMEFEQLNDDCIFAEGVWESAEKEPKLLFKYKSVEYSLDLQRLLDGLKNNYLYLPTVRKLNDSLEGKGTHFILNDSSVFESEKANEYRILSLSATCFSPVMWAHYADNRKGICLGFYRGNRLDCRNKSVFQCAEKVVYENSRKVFSCDEKSAVCDDLLHKRTDWAYEQEWRIIRDADYCMKEPDHFIYDEEDLACIILGEKVLNCVVETIQAAIKGVPLYRVACDAEGYRLILKRKEKIIATNEELLQDLSEIKA